MKFLLVIIIIAIMALGGIVLYKTGKEELKVEKPQAQETILPEKEISMSKELLPEKSIAMVIVPNFRDEEYFVPKEILEKAGAKVRTVGLEKGQIIGAEGGEAIADLAVGETNPQNFEAVLFIGGPGMAQRLNNENLQELAKKTVQAGRVLGAICIAPALLAKADVLTGKKATVWTSALDKSAAKILRENGAIYEDKPVVTDGRIITANGPTAAKEFAQALIDLLK